MRFLLRLIITIFFLFTTIYAETEVNDSCNQADEITIVNNSTVTDTGSLLRVCTKYNKYGSCQTWSSDLEDYWKFTLTSSGTINITTSGYPSDSNMDSILYDSTCSNQITSDTSPSSNISMSYELPAGTYKIRLSRYDGWGTGNGGDYSLNVNFTPASPSFRIADFTQQEGNSGNTIFHIPVTLDPVSTEEQIIRYSTTAGTATVLSDFMSSTGTLTYSPGDSVKYIDITVYGDTLYENNEVFYINLSHVSGSAPIADAQATITIGNDDVPGYITIEDDFSINEGNYGEYTKVVTVSATDLNGNTFTVDYTTNDGTATAGSDYTANSGTLTFTEDAPTQTIELVINGDSTQESDETFQVLLSNPFGSIINNSSTTITLVNDDGGSSHIGSRDFIIRNPSNTRNIKGNLKVVGNTVLCYKAAGSSECSERTNPNNDTTLSFIDQDSTNYTYNNSSSATITGIPSDADIVWAALYTQGYPDWDSATTVSRLNATPVYLTSPAGTTYDVEPNIIDLYRWNGYAYSTFSELPNLIGLKGSEVNGQWMAANIKAREGQDTYLGYFGAWTLVIIYKDSSESLKNISVFDGYTNVSSYNPNVSIPISGFLTPTKGDIASTVSLFVGEGDNAYTGDQLLVEGTSIAETNAFNSSTSGFTASPSLTNNFGIDIQNHDIGTTGHNLIANNQTSATIQLTSSGDSYFPSMVAFTTDLYEPRVCYYINRISDDDNNTVFADRKFTSSIQDNTNYHFDIWFSNMKKSSDDTDIETAKLVQIYMNTNDINYTTSSTSIMNLGQSAYDKKTDLTDSDIFEFAEDQNQSNYRIGIGSNGLQGGTIEPADSFNDDTKKAFVTFESKFNLSDSNTSSVDLLDFFNFKASFKTDILTITSDNAQEIEQCLDLNTTASVTQPPKGAFNVVNANFSGGSLNSDSDTALFTQVSSQNFSVKVVALNNDFQTLQSYTGDVNLSLISSPSYTGDESSDQALCDSATSVGSPITIQFNNETIKPISLVTNDAMKSASFKISFESNGVVKHVCSTDSFAIRPANYSYSFTPSTLIGGKEHTLTSNAGTSLYDGTASQTISLIVPPGCGLGADTNTTSITFSGGIDSSLVRTGNIGDYNITVVDNTWTGIDQGTSHGDDCIVGSFENTPSGGLVGCNTQTSQTFTFSPKDFLNTLALQNFNANNFTYISNDNNMSATATATITARLDNNTTASAYSANCYAKDINTTISLIDEPLASEWLTNDRNATVRIMFFDTNTTNSELNATGSSTLSSGQNNFNNGIANITINFNFDRNTSIPDEPFHISRNDFNISVIDTNGVTGIDFNRTNDTNTTFYYGRVYAPDQTFNGDNGNAQVYYEVYCVDCNRTSLNIAGGESVDSINWFQNTLHVNLDGNVTRFESIGNVRFGGANYANADNNSSTVLINQGNEQQLLRINTLPYIDRITYTPHPWLVFNPSNPNATTGDFMVEFTSRGGWGGEGSVDQTDDNNTGIFIHDQNITTNQIQKRMDW